MNSGQKRNQLWTCPPAGLCGARCPDMKEQSEGSELGVGVGHEAGAGLYSSRSTVPFNSKKCNKTILDI